MNSVSLAIQSHFLKKKTKKQHKFAPITDDTLSSKLLNYNNFNAQRGTNIKTWKILSFNVFLRKKLLKPDFLMAV